MSVLLNAVSRKKALKSSEKVKRKCPPKKSLSCDSSLPPTTSDTTTVWFWKLNGVQTTVMFSKDDGEVWCNGYILPTEIKEDPSLGFIIEFFIELDESSSTHKGHLIVSEDGTTLLTIDGVMIPKYKNK